MEVIQIAVRKTIGLKPSELLKSLKTHTDLNCLIFASPSSFISTFKSLYLMGRKQKIPKGCKPKEIRHKSLALIRQVPRFAFPPPHPDDPSQTRSWLTCITIVAFHQGDFPACWSSTVCTTLQAYFDLYGIEFDATKFSPQCLIDCIACIIRDKVLVNWFAKDKSYAYGTFQALCFAAKYGVASLESYDAYSGKMRSCKKYKPVAAPVRIISLKMYEKSFAEKQAESQVKNTWERLEENLKVGFNQTIVDEWTMEDMAVASDQKVAEFVARSPMSGTYQCFRDYEYYTGEGVYYGPMEHKIKVDDERDEPTYHAVVVIGTNWDADNNLILQVRTSNDDFMEYDGIGYISRHLFMTLESVDLASSQVETSDAIFK